jgi:hypothetical protein
MLTLGRVTTSVILSAKVLHVCLSKKEQVGGAVDLIGDCVRSGAIQHTQFALQWYGVHAVFSTVVK